MIDTPEDLQSNFAQFECPTSNDPRPLESAMANAILPGEGLNPVVFDLTSQKLGLTQQEQKQILTLVTAMKQGRLPIACLLYQDDELFCPGSWDMYCDYPGLTDEDEDPLLFMNLCPDYCFAGISGRHFIAAPTEVDNWMLARRHLFPHMKGVPKIEPSPFGDIMVGKDINDHPLRLIKLGPINFQQGGYVYGETTYRSKGDLVPSRRILTRPALNPS